MPTVSELYATAVGHHRAGRLAEAETIYRHILAYVPDNAQIWYSLGVLSHQTGNYAESVESYRRAVAIKPDWPEAQSNLGLALRALGRLEDAASACRRAVELKPDLAEANLTLGLVWKDSGKLEEAEASFRRVVHLQPGYAEGHYLLGNTLVVRGKLDEAEACLRRAISLLPTLAQAHDNLGNVLQSRGMLDASAECYRRAVELSPDLAGAHNNLGVIRLSQGRTDEAEACFRQSLEIRPDQAAVRNNLGTIWMARTKLDEAAGCFQRALEFDPNFADAHNNLGLVRLNQGLQDEAITCYRRALERKPDYADAYDNLLYSLYFSTEYDAAAIYREHVQWAERFEQPGLPSRPADVDLTPGRRLRVGYVSPNFRTHPVGRFMLPILEAHDHDRFEVFSYSLLDTPDALTERCRRASDVWRDVAGRSTEELAEVVRRDRIDVLVDLTMHMSNNYLSTFARKPAPVQMTYLAYCGTTGLRAIDYRLTDPFLDPPGRDEAYYSEHSIRLPETYWCYRPMAEAPPVAPPPAETAGHVTFGCLNNFCKVTPPTLTAWVRILQSLPESRLLLHAQEGNHRQRVYGELAAHGVSPDRLTFVGVQPPTEYFRLYNRIDVALDPFPYGGGTTSCDALVMGVPVVSLAGTTAVGRGGRSILSNVGLADFVANHVNEYVTIATELGCDPPRLTSLRRELRGRMQSSPLMNAPRFTRHVERAYLRAWEIFAMGGEPRAFTVEPAE
jgi:predicted O-linked N-acetylglucosamine transferase (SPINDLY family)